MDSVKGSPRPESFYVDEWDENFINEAFQFADRASSNAVANPADHPVNPNFSQLPEQDAFHCLKPSQSFRSERRDMPSSDAGFKDVCFSPPRELSQRFPKISEAPPNGVGGVTEENRFWRNDIGVGRENKEVERLKEELKHLSKKFTLMEQECITLKKDRDKCREQLKCVVFQPEAKDAEIHCLKSENLGDSKQNHYLSSMFFENTTLSTNCVEKHDFKMINLNEDGSAVSELKRRVKLDNEATTSCGAQECFLMERSTSIKHRKTKAIQTDTDQDNTTIIQQKRLLNEQRIVSNLHAVWGLCNKKSGNTLVLKLLKTCSEDLFTLFRCINMPLKCNLNGLANESISEVALDDKSQSIPSNDAAKASRFYQLLLKMCNEIVPLQTVVDALLDLCNNDNVTVAHVSLRILHATLQHFVPDSSSLRSCVFVGPSNGKSVTGSGSIAPETELLKSRALQMTENADEGMPVSSVLVNLSMDGDLNSSSTMLLPFESLLRIFEMMRKIVAGNLKDYMRLEGLSIMSLIMMESKPNTDREKFCSINLLQTLSTIMSREAGVHVRRQAVRLLFLLFNSPKMLLMLFSGQENDTPAKVDTQKFTAILHGEINSLLGNIADCLTLNKSDAEELKFQRRVIILLAFLASSGKNGFELLLRPVTSQQINFLELIIQLLAFEMDAEIPTSGAIQNFCKDRISLIREALILLNRLTSHPTYSEATLRALTGSKTTTSLTIDVASCLPRRIPFLMKQQHGTKKTQASAEINDLARLFQLRVFSFLGVNIS